MQGMTYIKKFIKELNGDVNFQNIRHYCERIGFTIRMFGHDEKTSEIMNTLKINVPEREKGITYDKNGNRFIFINDKLDTFEKIETLLHEVGHILLEHKTSMLRKEVQECEANAFSLCVLTMRSK